jgi:heat shock protein HslJ
MKARILALGACALVLAGCQSTEQQLDAQQQQAIDTALARLKFDMNCPSATGEVLSRQMIEPVSVRFGIQRAEYTIGVSGCNQRQTIVVLCPQDGSGCFAGGPRQ